MSELERIEQTELERIKHKVVNGWSLTAGEQEFLFNVLGDEISDIWEVSCEGSYLSITYEIIYEIDGKFYRGFYDWDGDSIYFTENPLVEVVPRECTRTEYVSVNS